MHFTFTTLTKGGDVHVGGSTTIYKNDQPICNQLTCSAISQIEQTYFVNALLKIMMHYRAELREGWHFEHHHWVKENNYGIVHISSNPGEKKPIINAYVNIYDKSYIQ